MRSILLRVVSAIGLTSLLCSCTVNGATVPTGRHPLLESFHTQRMLVMEQPPIIAATSLEDLPIAINAANRANSTELSQRESARWTSIDALPFLTSTEAGREFLAATTPRALARGMPQEACPHTAAASAAPGTPRGEVAGEAIRSCVAQIRPSESGCGCRVVALDDMITVPVSATAYATGISARLRSVSLGLDVLLVAEEENGGILLRDLRGPVAHLTYGADDTVELRFDDTGQRFEGHRIPVGFRRGRVAERIYAADAEGKRISLLIGFEPDELAGGAAAWLAWPPEG